MTQQQIRIDGEIDACKCGRQPKHYHERGRNRHFLECSPCNVRTAKCDTFQEAVEAWEGQKTEIFVSRRAA